MICLSPVRRLRIEFPADKLPKYLFRPVHTWFMVVQFTCARRNQSPKWSEFVSKMITTSLSRNASSSAEFRWRWISVDTGVDGHLMETEYSKRKLSTLVPSVRSPKRWFKRISARWARWRKSFSSLGPRRTKTGAIAASASSPSLRDSTLRRPSESGLGCCLDGTARLWMVVFVRFVLVSLPEGVPVRPSAPHGLNFCDMGFPDWIRKSQNTPKLSKFFFEIRKSGYLGWWVYKWKPRITKTFQIFLSFYFCQRQKKILSLIIIWPPIMSALPSSWGFKFKMG